VGVADEVGLTGGVGDLAVGTEVGVAGLLGLGAAAGALVSAMSSASSAVTLFLVLHAATPL
ncbi:hypothetical protein ACWDE9_42405, partial [Streptomyces olivaceoviridis]